MTTDLHPDLRIHALTSATPLATQHAIDRILRKARTALLSQGEHLASADERATEAEADPTRLLVYAKRGARTLGVVDAVLHSPCPGDLTIAQLAVRKSARFQGVGRALVEAVVTRGIRRLEAEGIDLEASNLVASVLTDNVQAIAFWQSLGLVERETDGPTIELSAELLDLLPAPLDRSSPLPRPAGSRPE